MHEPAGAESVQIYYIYHILGKVRFDTFKKTTSDFGRFYRTLCEPDHLNLFMLK